MMPKPTVPELLEGMADTFRQRNEIYGDNYKKFGYVMAAMFPEGVTINTPEQWNRFGNFFQLMTKMTRLANSNLTHIDSAHDMGTYSAMMEELIR